MPAIQGAQLSTVAKNLFKAKAIQLPVGFSGLPPQHPFTGKDQKPPDAAALFLPPSTLNLHVDTTSAIGQDVADLIDACSDAIGMAFQQWQSAAKFVGVLINGPAGMATPGSLVAPPAMSGPAIFGQANVGGRKPMFIKYVQTITNAVGTAFTAWQTGYMVTLIFPGGAVCSCTMPPSPNIPMPVIGGSSPGDAMMTPSSLKGLMLGLHGPPGNHGMDIFDAFSQALALQFLQWKGSTQITNVLGAGGVAPPPPAPPAPVVMAVGMGGMLT